MIPIIIFCLISALGIVATGTYYQNKMEKSTQELKQLKSRENFLLSKENDLTKEYNKYKNFLEQVNNLTILKKGKFQTRIVNFWFEFEFNVIEETSNQYKIQITDFRSNRGSGIRHLYNFKINDIYIGDYYKWINKNEDGLELLTTTQEETQKEVIEKIPTLKKFIEENS